jgi:hypothetical protein
MIDSSSLRENRKKRRDKEREGEAPLVISSLLTERRRMPTLSPAWKRRERSQERLRRRAQEEQRMEAALT